MLFDALLLLALILFNGVFAMAEMAVVSSRKARLQQLADDGAPGAASALQLANEPSYFLSTIQVGITLIGVLTGAIGEATMANPFAAALSEAGMPDRYAQSVALAVVVVAITLVSLIVGELVPKRLALRNPEALASLVARPMNWLARVAHPVVRLLSLATDAVLRLFGVRHQPEPPVTEEEIKVLMEQGAEAGVFERSEQAIVARLFTLDEMRVGSVMTPRVDLVSIGLDEPVEDVRRTLRESRHARYPVLDGDGQPVGLLKARDFVDRLLDDQPVELSTLADRPLFVPETITAMKLLETFKKSRQHAALVVDEYGELQGLVTLNDVLEALVGDIASIEENVDPDIVRRDDTSWLMDGSVSISRFRDVTGADEELPDEDSGAYNTLGGLAMAMLGHIPVAGNRFETAEFAFEVVDMDRRRVDKLMVARKPPGIGAG
jgi:putative hemolysin